MKVPVPAFRNRWLPGLVLCGIFAAGGCGGEHQSISSANRPTVRVETSTLRTLAVPLAGEAVGSVHPWMRASPGTKIMGRVERVFVRAGDRVRKGQALAILESRDLAAAADRARAAVSLAEASLVNARAQHERMTLLHGRGSVTDKSLEDATSAFRMGEARLAEARAALAAAEVTLSYAEIVSPTDGWVTSKRVEEGDMASPGASLFTVEDTSRVKVMAQLPESEVVGLAPGDPARVRVDVLDRDWDAAIDRVLPAGDPRSRTFQVELVLSNPHGQLKSGMFARVVFPRGSREALFVPPEAVVTRGQLQGVFVVDGQQTARLRWVRVGPVRDGQLEVISGLQGGERIVQAPPEGFTDGTPVETR